MDKHNSTILKAALTAGVLLASSPACADITLQVDVMGQGLKTVTVDDNATIDDVIKAAGVTTDERSLYYDDTNNNTVVKKESGDPASSINTGNTIIISATSLTESEPLTLSDNISNLLFSYNSTTANTINSGSNVTIDNTAYVKNTAGAISNSGNLSITDSSFENNTSAQGGAIYNTGNIGTVDADGKILTAGIADTTFTGNSGQYGGAIYNSGTLTIAGTESDNVIFQNNNATSSGGAIYNNGTLTITNSIFRNNNATSSGGAIYANNDITITDTDFLGNKATNDDRGRGGAIYIADGKTVTINAKDKDNVVFRDNTAKSLTLNSGAAYIRSNAALKLNAANGKNILIDDTIYNDSGNTLTGKGININNAASYTGTVAFNDTVAQNTANSTINLYNGTLKLGTSEITTASPALTYGKITGGKIVVYNNFDSSPILNMIDNSVQNYVSSTIDLNNNTLEWKFDVSATTSDTYGFKKSDYISDNSTTRTGTISIEEINILDDTSEDPDYSFAAYIMRSNLNNTVNIAESAKITDDYTVSYDSNTGFLTLIKNIDNNKTLHTQIIRSGDKSYTTAYGAADNKINISEDLGVLLGDSLTVYGNTYTLDGLHDTDKHYGGLIVGKYGTQTLNLNNKTDENSEAQTDKFTITNFSSTDGGAFYVDTKGTLNADNVIFQNNNATSSGGAIYNNGTLTITNSIFQNNTSHYGGAIYANNDVTITDTDFIGNRATYSYSAGGAIHIAGDKTVTINAQNKDVIFRDNFATDKESYNGGSAAYISSNAALNLNAANDKNILIDDTIRSSSTTEININNGASYTGTVAFNDTVAQNTADGTINLYNGTLKLGTSEITTASPALTYGKITGGKIVVFNDFDSSPILNMIDNSVQNYVSSTIDLNNNNTLEWKFDVNIDGTGSSDRLSGATITNAGAGSIIISAINIMNTPPEDPTEYLEETIRIAESGSELATALALATNPTVTWNKALSGVEVTYNDGEITLFGSLAQNLHYYVAVKNTSPRTYTLDAHENVNSNLGTVNGAGSILTIDSNSAQYSINGTQDENSYEGITVLAGQTLNVKNVGSLAEDGSVVASINGFKTTNGGFINNSGTVNIENSVFDNNSATSAGGAIYNTGSIGTVDADGNILTEGITGATFTNNGKVTNGNYNTYYGGAIYNTGTLAITNSTFGGYDEANKVSLGNSANNGGAIYNSGILSIAGTESDNVIFQNNNASSGGAIYNTGSIGTVNITGKNTFKNNSATSGGAIYNISAGTIKITANDTDNISFIGNSAKSYGGAIYTYNCELSSDSMINITGKNTNNILFTNNTGYAGGVIYNKSLGNSTVNIHYATFEDNSVSDVGGVIYNFCECGKTEVNIFNTSFNRNNAASEKVGGGAIFNKKGTINITNGVFNGNSASNGGAIYNSAGTVTLQTTAPTDANDPDTAGSMSFVTANDTIYNLGTLHINPYSGDGGADSITMHKDIVITNPGTIDIDNSYNLNNLIAQSGESATTNFNGNIVAIQSNGDITGGNIDVKADTTLNLMDSNIRDVFSETTLSIDESKNLNLNMDVNLLNTTSDKILSTLSTDSKGNIVVKQINITQTDFNKKTITVNAYDPDSALSQAIAMATAEDTTIYWNNKATELYTATYDKDTGSFTFTFDDTKGDLKFYVSDYDVPSRTYNMSADENVTENLGAMVLANSTLNINMNGNDINGTTDSTSHTGITVQAGQTLNIYGADTTLAEPVAGKISGFTTNGFINNSGTVSIENTEFENNTYNSTSYTHGGTICNNTGGIVNITGDSVVYNSSGETVIGKFDQSDIVDSTWGSITDKNAIPTTYYYLLDDAINVYKKDLIIYDSDHNEAGKVVFDTENNKYIICNNDETLTDGYAKSNNVDATWGEIIGNNGIKYYYHLDDAVNVNKGGLTIYTTNVISDENIAGKVTGLTKFTGTVKKIPFGNIIYNRSQIDIAGTTFANGTANDIEWGLILNDYKDNIIPQINISDSRFYNNSLKGSYICNSGNLNITDTEFYNNSVNGVYNYHGIIRNNYRGAYNSQYNYNATMSIYNSVFSNNTVYKSTSSNNAGVIYNDAKLIIYDSLFKNNKTYSDYASSYNITSHGGAIHNTSPMNNKNPWSEINNSIFAGNEAGKGGAIYNYGAYLNITNSSFINNKASDPNTARGIGGAIYNKSYTTGGIITITNSTFDGNTATSGKGGAIYNENGSITLQTTAPIGDISSGITEFKTATDTIYNGGTLNINPYSGDGGADSIKMHKDIVITNTGTVNINNSYNLNNTIAQSGDSAATNFNGNTIGLQANGDITGGNINVVSNTLLDMMDSNIRDVFSGTTLKLADTDGNATTLTLNMDVDLANLTADTLSSLKASDSVGYIKVQTINLISDIDLSQDEITVDAYKNSDLKNIISLSDGFKLLLKGEESEDTDVYKVTYIGTTGEFKFTLRDNLGNLKFYVSTLATPKRTYRMAGNENVEENLGDLNGTDSILSIAMEGNDIIGNNHQGINVKAGQTLNVYGTDTTLPEAEQTAGVISGFKSANGGFINNNGTVYIEKATFSGNKADDDDSATSDKGGAIYNNGTIIRIVDNNKSAGIIDSLFGGNNDSGNIADYGGAIYNDTNGVIGEITNGTISVSGIEGTTFTTNSAKEEGGAIYNAGTLAITGSIFNGRGTDEGVVHNASRGGAIYNRGTLAIDGKTVNNSIVKTEFNRNTASGNGGAIYNGGPLTISNSFLLQIMLLGVAQFIIIIMEHYQLQEVYLMEIIKVILLKLTLVEQFIIAPGVHWIFHQLNLKLQLTLYTTKEF